MEDTIPPRPKGRGFLVSIFMIKIGEAIGRGVKKRKRNISKLKGKERVCKKVEAKEENEEGENGQEKTAARYSANPRYDGHAVYSMNHGNRVGKTPKYARGK